MSSFLFIIFVRAYTPLLFNCDDAIQTYRVPVLLFEARLCLGAQLGKPLEYLWSSPFVRQFYFKILRKWKKFDWVSLQQNWNAYNLYQLDFDMAMVSTLIVKWYYPPPPPLKSLRHAPAICNLCVRHGKKELTSPQHVWLPFFRY